MESLMTIPRGSLAPRAAVDLVRAELTFRQFVAPIAKSAFGELHDVALVDEGDALALVDARVFDARRIRRSCRRLTGLMPMPTWSGALFAETESS